MNSGTPNIKISVGDSARGYDSALVMKTDAGTYRLVHGTIVGRIGVIRKSVAALNRGENTYVTLAGDCLTIRVGGE